MTRRGIRFFQLCCLLVGTMLLGAAAHGDRREWALAIFMAGATIVSGYQLWKTRGHPEPVAAPQTKELVLRKAFAVVLGFVTVMVLYRFFGR